jgi:hypothetical protein
VAPAGQRAFRVGEQSDYDNTSADYFALGQEYRSASDADGFSLPRIEHRMDGAPA